MGISLSLLALISKDCGLIKVKTENIHYSLWITVDNLRIS